MNDMETQNRTAPGMPILTGIEQPGMFDESLIRPMTLKAPCLNLKMPADEHAPELCRYRARLNAASAGYSDAICDQIGLLVEAIVRYTIRTSHPPGGSGTIRLQAEYLHDGIVFSVRDWGPSYPAGADTRDEARALLREIGEIPGVPALADSLHIISFGAAGKAIRFFVPASR